MRTQRNTHIQTNMHAATCTQRDKHTHVHTRRYTRTERLMHTQANTWKSRNRGADLDSRNRYLRESHETYTPLPREVNTVPIIITVTIVNTIPIKS